MSKKKNFLAIICFLIVGLNEIVIVYQNNLALIIAWLCVSLCVGLIENFHPMIIAYPNTKFYVSQKWTSRLFPFFVVIALIINSLIQGNNLYIINFINSLFIANGSFWSTNNSLIQGNNLYIINLINFLFIASGSFWGTKYLAEKSLN